LIAATAVLVCAAAITITLGVSDDPPTREQLHDPIAARELVTLMRAGEQQRYVARYVVTRERADGAQLPTAVLEAHSPAVQLTRQGDTLRIELTDTRYDCERIEDEPQCFAKPGGLGLAPSAVLEAAIAAAPYDVLRRGTATIAGEKAACFTVTANVPTRQLPEIGRRATYCLAADGIPLREERVGTATERREAQSVVRSFDRAALAPVLAGFETVIPDYRR
jgi:hypothetical protein